MPSSSQPDMEEDHEPQSSVQDQPEIVETEEICEYLIEADISHGMHDRPMPAVSQDPDDEPPPPFYFVNNYPPPTFNLDSEREGRRRGKINANQYLQMVPIQQYRCNCIDNCATFPQCACQRIRGSHPYYDSDGLLVFRKDPLAEQNQDDEKGKVTIDTLWQAPNVPQVIYECNEDCSCSIETCPNRVTQKPIK